MSRVRPIERTSDPALQGPDRGASMCREGCQPRASTAPVAIRTVAKEHPGPYQWCWQTDSSTHGHATLAPGSWHIRRAPRTLDQGERTRLEGGFGSPPRRALRD